MPFLKTPLGFFKKKSMKRFVIDHGSSFRLGSESSPVFVLANYPGMAAKKFAKSMGPGVWKLSVRPDQSMMGPVTSRSTNSVVRSYKIRVGKKNQILKFDVVTFCDR